MLFPTKDSIQFGENINHTEESCGVESSWEANEGKTGNKPVPKTAPRKCLRLQHEQNLLLPLFSSNSWTIFFDILRELRDSEEFALLTFLKVKLTVVLEQVIHGVCENHEHKLGEWSAIVCTV